MSDKVKSSPSIKPSPLMQKYTRFLEQKNRIIGTAIAARKAQCGPNVLRVFDVVFVDTSLSGCRRTHEGIRIKRRIVRRFLADCQSSALVNADYWLKRKSDLEPSWVVESASRSTLQGPLCTECVRGFVRASEGFCGHDFVRSVSCLFGESRYDSHSF